MQVNLVAEQMISVGEPVVIEASSPRAHFGIIFEDDGTTGYLYGLDFSRKENPIVDALHIYNVESVADRSTPSKIQIGWSRDGKKGALLINSYLHAVFNFEARRGYCRTGFPPPNDSWSKQGHLWDDNALEVFE